MREIHSFEELTSLIGQEVAVSDWIAITQERVNTFAQATGDHQWIHVDVERSRRESPYGGTIAHGFLTLSLAPTMMESTIRLSYLKMVVNYGLNKVRFPAPAPVGCRLRGRITLQAVANMHDPEGDGAQAVWQFAMEREGGDKPVCVAELITRCYA